MLRSIKDLEKCTIGATDGVIGSVQDVYFDDEAWVIRYLVVKTGTWLSDREVLISPYSAREWDWEGKVLPISITREQVKNSPVIDTQKPVSRQQESGYLGYYGYPPYWGGGGFWGPVASPGMRLRQVSNSNKLSEAEVIRRQHEDPHLRSCNAVVGYHLHASDGEIGHVQGYLVDDNSWAIRFLIVNTSNWWLGHQVLIAPEWIQSVSWSQSTVTADLERQAVKTSRSYDPNTPLSSDSEASIYKHYGRSAYQKDEPKRNIAWAAGLIRRPAI